MQSISWKALALLSWFLNASAFADSAKADFNFDVKPILSDRCYACHGPSQSGRKAGLRLHMKEDLFKESESGLKVIEPGFSGKSELYRRLTSADDSYRMPPPESKLALDPAEIETIRLWIEQGAEWKSHWAFAPVEAAPVPEVQQKDWPCNPIDYFVLARLEQEGLAPEPEARPERILRRVAMDLTGLPPTLEEINAFLADERSEAYERQVDAYLNSEAYGERMASEWLDVARFADTYGYQADRFNHLWPWRDWVIRAFNDNLPFDDFITWQMAGDLLPNPTRDQVLATAFHRNHRQTNEGGSINEEFRVEYVADRVKTTGLAFLGLTLECARCHDHKFDPISQKDYYRFFGFFNSTDESGLYSHFTDAIPSPALLLYKDGEKRRHEQLKRDIRARESELQKASEFDAEKLKAWLSGEPEPSEPEGRTGYFPFETVDGQTTPNLANPEQSGKLVEAPQSVAGRRGKALQFSGENSVDIAGSADFTRADPFSLSLWLRIPKVQDRLIVLHHSKAGSDAGSRGYELLLEDGRASFALIHFWPGNAVKIETAGPLPLEEWIQIGATYDGSSKASGLRLYLNGEPAETRVVRDQLFKDITYGDPVPLQLAARFRGPGFKNGLIDELQIFDRALSGLDMRYVYDPDKARALPEFNAIENDAFLQTQLWNHYLKTADPEYARLAGELKDLRVRENELINQVPEIMVMGDLPEPRPTHVLKRGAYDAPGERVEPGAPESILPWDDRYPKNRLGLEQWLVDPDNPLTSRVIVNRYWQLLFGRGLVATPEDFGSQGKLPSHPRLLDWLAQWFVDNDWDLKGLHRLIATSSVYRQSSFATDGKRAKDPVNVLLSRGPSHRWSAEALRDNALSAAGLLNRTIGGPSVQSREQSGYKLEQIDQSNLPASYRRSLYTYIKRTTPSPYMITFDAPSREDCVARRQTTNTPLQALILLNDSLFHQAAGRIAGRLMERSETNWNEKVALGFRMLTGRRPDEKEMEILRRLFEEQRALFENDSESMLEFLNGFGDASMMEANWKTPEFAALAVVAKTLLSFDETMNKR